MAMIFNSIRIVLLAAALSSSISEAANLRKLQSGSSSFDFPLEQSEDEINGSSPVSSKTQSECLSERYPYVPAVVDALHAQVVGWEIPLEASSIDEANEVYKLIAEAIRGTEKLFPPEERPRFLCLSGLDDLYCVRNCEYFDLIGRDFCQASNNSTWVANWVSKELHGKEDSRFRILEFDPSNEKRPLSTEIVLIEDVGRGFAMERYYWPINGWLLDPVKPHEEDCLGCGSSVLTETYTRGYTLAGGSPTRQGIAAAGVTLPELPEGDAPSTSLDPKDPEFVHPMYARIASICPCC